MCEQHEQLRERVRLLEIIVENFPGGIAVFDEHLRLVICNQQQKDLLGYPAELFGGGPPSMETLFRYNASRGEYGSGDVDELVTRRMQLVKRYVAHSYERTRPNGMVLEIRGVPLSGGGFITTSRDITERGRQQAFVVHLAYHDALTGLPNRTFLLEKLGQSLNRARHGEKSAIHFVDLDRFKAVNDECGHAAGDELLKQIAERFRCSTRDSDVVARLGGDEFVILQQNIKDRSDASTVAERLVRSAQEPFEIFGTQVTVGVSVGVTLCSADSVSAEQLLSEADSALYRCKEGGRNCFAFFDHSEIRRSVTDLCDAA